MKNLHWHLKLRVSPGLKEPEEIEGFNFEIFNGNTYVNIYFHTTSFDQKLPSQLYEYEYAEETLTREFLEKLRILLLKRFIFRKAFESIEIAVEEGPTLLNKEELKGSSVLKGRQVSSSFDIALRVLDVDDTLHETIDYWNRISKFLSLGLQEDILRLSDWFEKSFKEKDLIQRFILSWIGFNGLYNLYCDSIYKNLKLNEAEKFEKMVDELIGISEKANIVKNNAKNINKLIDFNILSDNGKTNWSKRLKEEMGKHEKDFKEIIKLIIRCIYGIRKQVFHEAPRPIDVKSQRQLEIASLAAI